MPLYEYGCRDCGYDFEVMQKMSDPDPAGCPKCSGTNVSKLISAGAFHLKGGGWYSDGYSKEKKPASCDAAKAPSCGGCPAA
ncbi:MAG: zinc ribbon domain-containing protein [Deltaproteobacteria bacterium]|nr:zinc ribbon domain-containing protein [Deltaproteobacteria bacterium]